MEFNWKEITDPEGQPAREFRIATDQGRLVTGAAWLHESLEGAALTCFGHGASGDRFQWPIPLLANRLRKETNSIGLSLDGPVHGLRRPETGHPRELFMQGLAQGAVIDQMASDWRIALDFIGHEWGISIGRMGYFGLSMGTMLGLSFLQARDALVAAVLGLAGTSPQVPGALRMKAAAERIKAQVLYLMNLNDEFFSQEMYLDLVNAIASEDKRIHANQTSHDYLALDEVEFAFNFLREHLTNSRPRTFRSIVDGSTAHCS